MLILAIVVWVVLCAMCLPLTLKIHTENVFCLPTLLQLQVGLLSAEVVCCWWKGSRRVQVSCSCFPNLVYLERRRRRLWIMEWILHAGDTLLASKKTGAINNIQKWKRERERVLFSPTPCLPFSAADVIVLIILLFLFVAEQSEHCNCCCVDSWKRQQDKTRWPVPFSRYHKQKKKKKSHHLSNLVFSSLCNSSLPFPFHHFWRWRRKGRGRLAVLISVAAVAHCTV